MPTSDERLAAIEAMMFQVQDDVREIKTEALRLRDRIHKLESTTIAFVQTQKDNRRREEEQYKRLGLRIQWAGIALAIALGAVPILLVILTGR